MGQKVILKNVTLAHESVWEPTDYQNDGNFKYGAILLIEKDSANDKAIRAAINAAAVEAWGEQAIATLRRISSDKTTFCYRDGDIKKNENYHGMWFISANRPTKNGRPGLCGPGGPTDRLTQESGKPYSGCVVNASLDVYGQKGKNEGMRCGIVGLQFVTDGEPFSGSPASVNDFEPLGEGDSSMDDFGDVAANGDGF